MTPTIKLNAAQCKRCGYVLLSLSVHDYKTHSCHPSIWFMVDGGTDYVRRGWGTDEDQIADHHYIERSIYWPESANES